MTRLANKFQSEVRILLENIEKVIIGKEEEIILSLVALLAKGHVLLEDVPGVGKTMLVRSLSKSIDSEFKRIQFTPDLLPTDITGTAIYNPRDLTFDYREGPIMSNIVLADEINRTSPKTQSALLEAMEEGNITIDGDTKKLPQPFFVMATQNPIEYEGTFPLPEAQLDRFIIKINLGYPTPEEEFEVLTRIIDKQPIEEIHSVLSLKDVIHLQEEVKKVYVGDSIKKYIVDLVNSTRNHPSVHLGVSPRGSIALLKASQAYAFIMDRDYVLPDDVQYLAPYTLSHRLIMKPELKYTEHSSESVIQDIVAKVTVPITKGMNTK